MGKKLFTVFLLLILFNNTFSQLPPDNPNYELVFIDEFDSTAMDNSKWFSGNVWNQTGYIDVSYCNNYQDTLIRNDVYGYRKRNFENCILDTTASGIMKIVSKKEDYLGEVWNWPLCTNDSCIGHICDYSFSPPRCEDFDTLAFNYTTNMLRSKETFKYGYFEIRCKISKPISSMTNKGVGPNFWLWASSSEVSWSEIDIFEFDGETSEFASAIHYEDMYGDTIHGIPNSLGRIEVDFSDFHTFAMNWTPEKIDFYLDDSLYVTSYMYADDFIPMPMIIDVNFPIHTMCQFVDTIYTQLPHYYEIDYVKVYQLKSDCNNDYQICDYNTIDYKHYKTITIANKTGNVTVPYNKKLYLIYADRLNISENFILQDGAEIFFERIPCFESIHNYSKKENIEPPPESFYKRLNPIYHEN